MVMVEWVISLKWWKLVVESKVVNQEELIIVPFDNQWTGHHKRDSSCSVSGL